MAATPAPTWLMPRARRLAVPGAAGLTFCSARGRSLRTRLFAKVTGIPL